MDDGFCPRVLVYSVQCEIINAQTYGDFDTWWPMHQMEWEDSHRHLSILELIHSVDNLLCQFYNSPTMQNNLPLTLIVNNIKTCYYTTASVGGEAGCFATVILTYNMITWQNNTVYSWNWNVMMNQTVKIIMDLHLWPCCVAWTC